MAVLFVCIVIYSANGLTAYTMHSHVDKCISLVFTTVMFKLFVPTITHDHTSVNL